MNKFSKTIVNWFNRIRPKSNITTSRCLDADSQSYVGIVPALPVGQTGHLAILDIYFSLIEKYTPAIFCDIGANKGEAGRRALALRPKMKVFGFEANPKIYDRYSQINNEAGVHWVNCAVADQNGTLALYVPKVISRRLEGNTLVAGKVVESADTGKSSLLMRDESAEYEIVEVPAITLDNFLSNNAPEGRVALWIDVEGAASLVLKGAQATIARTDIIIIEVEGFSFWQNQALVKQVVETLLDQDFIHVLRDQEYSDAQFNIIFIRKNKDLSLQQHWIGSEIDSKFCAVIPKSTPDFQLTPASTPIFVPCFNNPSYAENMLVQLQSIGFNEITFVDNASDSPAMHEWLDYAMQRGVKVERLKDNLGPKDSIFTPDRLTKLPRWFCITDPDLLFNPALPKDFLTILAGAMNRHGIGKAGFALDISNRQLLQQRKFDIGGISYNIWEWERQFWENRIDFTTSGDPIFKASVDTTFALYDLKEFRLNNMLNALRVGGRFTAAHLPWLKDTTVPSDEEKLYRSSQKFSYYLR